MDALKCLWLQKEGGFGRPLFNSWISKPTQLLERKIKMRSKDLFMGATVDVDKKLIMVSGGIDVNGHTIVLRVDVPEPGEYTVVKAEVNLTDESWLAWQINLGEGTSLPADGGADSIISRQFKNTKFLSDQNAILFWDGEVRPGDAIFKMARFNITRPKLILGHNRATVSEFDFEIPDEDDKEHDDTRPVIDLPDYLEDFYKQIQTTGFGEDRPRIEVDAAVRIVRSGGIDVASFMRNPLGQEHQGGQASHI